MALQQLQLSLQFGDFPHKARHRAALPRHAVTRAIRHALADDAEITVRIVGEEEGRELNKSYRKKDYATNVLTFDYAQEPTVMADLVLCAPVVAREAKEQGKTLAAHYAHLLVHGTLHAQGWRPARPMPRRWRPTKLPSWRSWVYATLIGDFLRPRLGQASFEVGPGSSYRGTENRHPAPPQTRPWCASSTPEFFE
jgi:probable rRNA maturation factor